MRADPGADGDRRGRIIEEQVLLRPRRSGQGWDRWDRWEWSAMAAPGMVAAACGPRRHVRVYRHGRGLPLPLIGFFLVFALLHGPFFFGALCFALMVAAVLVAMVTVTRFLVASLLGAAFAPPAPPSQVSRSRRPDILARSSGAGSQALYQRRLLDVLKERYVSGEITLDEFERRAGQIARDPSARHLN